jgi:hypothetical protein
MEFDNRVQLGMGELELIWVGNANRFFVDIRRPFAVFNPLGINPSFRAHEIPRYVSGIYKREFRQKSSLDIPRAFVVSLSMATWSSLGVMIIPPW